MRIYRVVPFLIASTAAAQPGRILVAGCTQPDYGFEGVNCINCEISGRGQPWIVFHNAPSIRGIRNPGPAFGKLQEGDTLIAINGVSITMRAAADLYANAKAGDTVEFRVRRAGRTVTTTIVTASCLPGRKVSWLWSPGDSFTARVWLGDSLRKRVVWTPMITPKPISARMKTPVLNSLIWTSPSMRQFRVRLDSTGANPGWIGIAMFRLLKTPDQMRAQDSAGAFGVPPEIAAVAAGSPAEAAGVVVGDTLVAVDGVSVLTSAGAQRFLNAPAGTTLSLTLRRNGQTRVVSIVPKEPPATPPARD